MLDFFAFRDKARAAFPSLIVSVLMWEKGSGAGGEVTMYKVKVSGQGIGGEFSSQGTDAEEALIDLIQKVAGGRAVVRVAKTAWQQSRREITVRPSRRLVA